jgi:predicted acylesterase/phospholipase RssA
MKKVKKKKCRRFFITLSLKWKKFKEAFSVIGVSWISSVSVVIVALLLFLNSQGKDAIMALGNSKNIYYHIIFTLSGIIWAFLIWYWARVIYYVRYPKTIKLEKIQYSFIQIWPRVLGGAAYGTIWLSLWFIAFWSVETEAKHVLIIIGSIFLFAGIVFLLIIIFRRDLPFVKDKEFQLPPKKNRFFVSFVKLKLITRINIITLSILMLTALVWFLITPISLGWLIGNPLPILLLCFSIWTTVLYWIKYASISNRLPFFIFIFILIILFSLTNGDNDVRVLDVAPQDRVCLTKYINDWYETRSKDFQQSLTIMQDGKSKRVPMIFILAEGGGIRAAYWTAVILSRLQEANPEFSSYLFAISSVSGGSFGATIFTTLLTQQDSKEGNYYSEKVRELLKRDFLSPIFASMFIRDTLQTLLPIPVQCFDRSKVFEEAWEIVWAEIMGNNDFASPFTDLWSGNKNSTIPALFLNSTRVEDGMPFVISNLELDFDKSVIHDIYDYPLASNDIRISTASNLSARFPLFSAAGIIRDDISGNASGFVDGGYFDNSGANTAYEVMKKVKLILGTKWSKIIPVVIFIQNSPEPELKYKNFHAFFYQMTTPLDTFFEVMGSRTLNSLEHVREFLSRNRGLFINYSLPDELDKRPEKHVIPLGWTLSDTSREIMNSLAEKLDIDQVRGLLPGN